MEFESELGTLLEDFGSSLLLDDGYSTLLEDFTDSLSKE